MYIDPGKSQQYNRDSPGRQLALRRLNNQIERPGYRPDPTKYNKAFFPSASAFALGRLFADKEEIRERRLSCIREGRAYTGLENPRDPLLESPVNFYRK